MKRTFPLATLVFIMMVSIILFTTCKRSEDVQSSARELTGGEKNVLKVGYLPISAALPLFTAIEHGLFDEQEISVEPVKYQNGALMAEDVTTGRIAAACPGPADVYLNREAQSEGRFKIYLQTVYTPSNFIYSILVRKDSEIKKLEDLREKKIGVFPGVTNKLLLEILLQQEFGWKPDEDFRVQGISAALQLDALETGEYDAICPLEPTGTIGTFRAGIKMIDKGPIERGVLNPLYITAHALSSKAINQNPQLIDKFVEAMEKAVDLMRENEQANRSFLPKYTFLTLEQSRLSPLGECLKVHEASRIDFQKLADLLTREGVLSRRVDVNTLYYESK